MKIERRTQPPAVEWKRVSLDLGEFALRDVSLRLECGRWLGVVGPTGAGKTLLLEVAAGFRAPTSGGVWRDGRDLTRVPAESRRIAYVPQEGLLFPHLDVRRNLLFAVRRARREVVRGTFDEIVDRLGLGHLLRRSIGAISGGEAQRVALGRALLADADLLLLDEATSALDEVTKLDVGDFLEESRRRSGITIVQVSHDRNEIDRLADETVVFERGRVLEYRASAVPAAAALHRVQLVVESACGS